MNERLTTLERRIDFLEARISKSAEWSNLIFCIIALTPLELDHFGPEYRQSRRKYPILKFLSEIGKILTEKLWVLIENGDI